MCQFSENVKLFSLCLYFHLDKGYDFFAEALTLLNSIQFQMV